MTIIDSLIAWIPKEKEVTEGEVGMQTSTSPQFIPLIPISTFERVL